MSTEIIIKLILLIIRCYGQGILTEDELKRYIRLIVGEEVAQSKILSSLSCLTAVILTHSPPQKTA